MKDKIIFKTKTFGNLKYIKPLIIYDYPRVFVCRGKTNKIYIFKEVNNNSSTVEW